MSNPSAKQSMQNATPPSSAPSTANAYCPSVPISVYRELAAELQSKQAMLDSLNAQNQNLVRQNQQLRQEIARVVQSHMHLQQVLASLQPVGATESPPADSESWSETTPSTTVRRPRSVSTSSLDESPPHPSLLDMAESATSPFLENAFTEQEEGRYRRPTPPERLSDVNGWWLVVAILLIVATAFGTGFLIVRPLLKGGR